MHQPRFSLSGLPLQELDQRTEIRPPPLAADSPAEKPLASSSRYLECSQASVASSAMPLPERLAGRPLRPRGLHSEFLRRSLIWIPFATVGMHVACWLPKLQPSQRPQRALTASSSQRSFLDYSAEAAQKQQLAASLSSSPRPKPRILVPG